MYCICILVVGIINKLIMIDTVVLRIHNIDKYPLEYEKYYKPSAGKNSFSTSYVDEDTGELIEDNKILANIYHDNSRVIPLTFRDNINIASSSYLLAYHLNIANNYLEFNFSIPKYLYGLNVLQFVSPSDGSDRMTFKMLSAFIEDFLKTHLVSKVSLHDVEINRIDLCYNQFFNCKEDSLQYLNEQKKLLVKYARSSGNRCRTYNDESFVYVTRRYSFKVYHKGTEFRKHDYKEIVKRKNPFNYPLQYFLDESDKILRYEMTFRASYLQYLTKEAYFSGKTAAENPLYKESPVYKFIQTYNKYMVESTFSKKRKTEIEKLFRQRKKFCIRSPFNVTTLPEVLLKSDSFTFDQSLFTMLYDKFWQKVRDYQLSTSFNFGQVSQKIKDYNESNELKNKLRRKQLPGLSQNRLLIPAMLAQFVNIAELSQYMPKRTFQALKADLKKIGISENISNLAIPQPKLDYSDYILTFSTYIKWTGY